jgi:oxalate decarboxylase/phosphoglucose isomerase-like protein (cupin superfamily)
MTSAENPISRRNMLAAAAAGGMQTAALVEVEPGGMREMHWHTNVDEWRYYIAGQARMGVFSASGEARTLDFVENDVGFVPFAIGHYVENTGNTTLGFLEIFKSDYYADVSFNQWLALTPPELVTGASAQRSAVHRQAAEGQIAGCVGIVGRTSVWHWCVPSPRHDPVAERSDKGASVLRNQIEAR